MPCVVFTIKSLTSFYGSSCANNGKGAINTPDCICRALCLYISGTAGGARAMQSAQRPGPDLAADPLGRSGPPLDPL
eukprot:4670758-Pyramimonas_sp.AAC.1